MEQKELFKFSLDNALEIIIMFDRTGRIVYANKTAVQQLEYADGLMDTMIMDIFPTELKVEDDALILDFLKGDEIKDFVAYRKNRTCFPAKARFYFCDGWRETVFICTAYNATTETFLEKRASQADQEVEAAQKVKSEFVANVTHELRTPVNGILGNTQELIKMESDREKLDLLHLVERGCNDMNALINNILDFSKLEVGKFVLELRQFNFRNMIEYVRKNHSNRIIEKGLDFSITVSPEIPDNIIGDELRIVQILNNLISNAYKFTAVGEIHVDIVKTAQEGKRAELFFMVSDTGIGIDKSRQDKLFKSFSQVDASISRKYGGTGLGLNICKQLVELMGGSIHVDSEAGRGTTFSFAIWIELVDGDEGQVLRTDGQIIVDKLKKLSENRISDRIWEYGAAENKEELEKKMSKLILSIEMDNWEKAEGFAETIKQLLEEAPREVKSAVLRLKMSVQKADYTKAAAAFEVLRQMI